MGASIGRKGKGSYPMGSVFGLTERGGGIPMPILPTENVGMMSGAIRKKTKDRRRDERGSRRGARGRMMQVTMKDPKTGRMYGGLVKDGIPKFKKPDFVSDEDFKKSFPNMDKKLVSLPRPIGERPNRFDESGIAVDPVTGKIVAPSQVGRRPLTGGYDPKSGVRYTDTGVPTAVEQTRRVPVQDPTLGGPPEREVPIPKERRQRITRESDPRGGAPFSPDERAMARDRFFETMFDRADERKQQKSMERAERDNVGDALRSERELRQSEVAGPGDERQGRRGEGGMRRRRRGGGMRRNRRGRNRDFTRRRSRMQGGRRGRSMEERAAFRDRYVSTLGGGFFS